MATPTNKKLYNYVKKLADKKFKSKSGIYRSSWIVQEYKKRGGKYKGSKPKNSGLKRWYKEKWVDLNRPIKNSKGKIIGYKSCGRSSVKKGKYPLCRPTYRITSKTPKTYKEISKKSIKKARSLKAKVKETKNIKFGGGNISDMGNFIESFVNKLRIEQTGGGEVRSQYYGKRSSIMVKVPVNVKKWAKYAFVLKKLGFKGATKTGWLRAKQLANKDYIPIEDFRYMRNWYARHRYTSYPGYKEWVDNGKPKDSSWFNKHAILSWITWGGNPGFKWVNSSKAIALLNKHYNKNYKKIKELN
jgi:hypothetical protein